MAFRELDISTIPVTQTAVEAVKGEAPSLLPPGRNWRLVWHDEFNGDEIDRTKWMCRESFWGRDFPAFAHDFEGVEMTGRGTVRLHLLRKGDEFCSPHLQTGSLTYDIPKDTSGWWPFGAYREPLFMHRYGYYEVRCRYPKCAGWHGAFWLQAPGVGSTPDPGACGVECDILETYRFARKEKKVICGNAWGGYGKNCVFPGHFSFDPEPDADGWCRHGVDWSPEGYVFYANGKKVGEEKAPVSHTEQFILLSTEPGGYRRPGNDGGLSAGRRAWGAPAPALFEATLPDFFEADYVRVFDARSR